MELIAKKRKILGKQVKKLRQGNLLPAVLYGKEVQSTPLEVEANTFLKVFSDAGESTLVDLVIEGEEKPRKVLISEIQYDPVSSKLRHINFHQVNLKEKITANVPIEITGESPAVREGKGIIITLIDEIEVECLPSDIPKNFTVDISNLNRVGDFIAVKELSYDKSKVKIELDSEELIIKLDYAQQPEEVEEETVSVEDVEVTGEKPKVERDEEEKENQEEKEESKDEKKEKKDF